LLPDIPVYLDSPLAIKATEIFRENKKYYDEEAMAIVAQGDDPFDLPNLQFTPSTKESIAINASSGSAIIIAGNGMCTAGRIKHHLKHNLWREGASLVIIGFQAEGTTGRRIIEGAKHVKIFRENVDVRAKVYTIGGFSAHADQEDLLEWVSHFESKPQVFLVHGEMTACEALAKEIEERFKLTTHVPDWKEQLILKAREVAIEKSVVEDAAPSMGSALLNTILEMEGELMELKGRVESEKEKIREEDVDRMKYIQEELQVISSELT
jgi:metallo-beta-lactamase family protein